RQATPLPQGSRAGLGASSAAVRSRRVAGTQTARAAAASSPQTAIPAGQPTPRASISGTVAAEASIAPVTSPAGSGPVPAPGREGNQALTTRGSSTPPTAIPIPQARVPPYRVTAEAPRPRTRGPAAAGARARAAAAPAAGGR